jgi:hypothetical protein
VACANIAKGFSPRLATEIRPRIGNALVAGLAPATACLARFDAAAVGPSAGVLRQRVVAYFQRMVQGVGRLAFPYAAPLVDRVRASGGADDLKECFVLCNQLCATFKKELAPFTETVTPALIAQTAAALAPFASPDGHAHGVLGVVSRVADVPDALARADASLAAREADANAAAAAAAAAAARKHGGVSRGARTRGDVCGALARAGRERSVGVFRERERFVFVDAGYRSGDVIVLGRRASQRGF